MTLRALGHVPESPGQMVDTAAPPAHARFSRDCWSTLWALGRGPRSHGTAGRPHGPERESTRTTGRPCGTSATGLSRPGQLADTEGTQPRDHVACNSWSNLQALGHVPEFPGTAGQRRGPSDPGLSRPGELSNSRAFEPEPESPGRGGRHRGPSDQIVRRTGELVEPVGAPNQARVSQGAGRHRRPTDPGPGHPGQQVDPAGPWARPESPWTAGCIRRLRSRA